MNEENKQSVYKPSKKECIRAAMTVASCPIDRVPIVLSILKQGGLDIQEVQPMIDEMIKPAVMINDLVNRYNISLREIGRVLNLQATQVDRIRNGQSILDAKKSEEIVSTLKQKYPQIE